MRVKIAVGTVALGSLLSLAGSVPAFAQETPSATGSTKASSDRQTTQKIRKALRDDKSLSSSAHNVRIASQNGKVTLTGPVRSEEEKQAVEQKATEVAGPGNVTNNLTVRAARSKTK